MSACLFKPFQSGDPAPTLDDRGAEGVVVFGIPFPAFPDLVRQCRQNLPASEPDQRGPLRPHWAERCFS